MMIFFVDGAIVIAIVVALVLAIGMGVSAVGKFILNALGIITIILMIIAGLIEICECIMFADECNSKNKSKEIIPIILNIIRSIPVVVIMYILGNSAGYSDDTILDVIVSMLAYIIAMLIPVVLLLINHGVNVLQQYCIDKGHTVLSYIIATIITIIFYLPLIVDDLYAILVRL